MMIKHDILAKQEGIPYKTVKQLRLDSLNILKIENLWQFTSLTKLQMDSNMIERIEGVDILGKYSKRHLIRQNLIGSHLIGPHLIGPSLNIEKSI